MKNQDIYRYSPLAEREKRELVRRYQQLRDSRALGRLFESFYGMYARSFKYIRLKEGQEAYEDAINDAFLDFETSISRFDLKRNEKVSTYVAFHIRSALTKNATNGGFIPKVRRSCFNCVHGGILGKKYNCCINLEKWESVKKPNHCNIDLLPHQIKTTDEEYSGDIFGRYINSRMLSKYESQALKLEIDFFETYGDNTNFKRKYIEERERSYTAHKWAFSVAKNKIKPFLIRDGLLVR